MPIRRIRIRGSDIGFRPAVVTTVPPRRAPHRVHPIRRPVPAEPPEAELEIGEAVPRVLKIIGTVVAPTTLLTALLFYFGRLHITGMFRYLRVNFTVLDLSFQDYLIRSADGLFVPIAAAGALVLVLLWAHGIAVRLLATPVRRAIVERAAPPVVVAGLALLVPPVAVLAGSPMLADVPEAPGLCLAAGVLLLAAGARMVRRGRPASAGAVIAEWGSVFVVVAVGLFWAVGNYAIGVGVTRGEQIEHDLPTTPDVVLYSEKDLGIAAPGVTETTCGDAASPSGHRYDGLKLVIQSAGVYLFLPAGWTQENGVALLVPRTDDLRLGFAVPGAPRPPTC